MHREPGKVFKFSPELAALAEALSAVLEDSRVAAEQEAAAEKEKNEKKSCAAKEDGRWLRKSSGISKQVWRVQLRQIK